MTDIPFLNWFEKNPLGTLVAIILLFMLFLFWNSQISVNPFYALAGPDRTSASSIIVTGTNGTTGVVNLAKASTLSSSCTLGSATVTLNGTTSLTCTDNVKENFDVTITATKGALSGNKLLTMDFANFPVMKNFNVLVGNVSIIVTEGNLQPPQVGTTAFLTGVFGNLYTNTNWFLTLAIPFFFLAMLFSGQFQGEEEVTDEEGNIVIRKSSSSRGRKLLARRPKPLLRAKAGPSKVTKNEE